MLNNKKTQGAISIFLVIILVPCLFITSLFVDMGRLNLSQGMAYSSADLALNSVLTKYDATLNEYYGLVASCQNMDEFYTKSEEYFLKTLQSRELSDDEIGLLTDFFRNTVRSIVSQDDGIQDMLKVEAVEAPKIEPIGGANLAKSALLKEQIVEFMKYRGPIQMATSIYGLLKNADGSTVEGLDAIMNSKTDDPIIEAKQDFHDAESDFLREAYNTYSYLYNNYSKSPIENKELTDRIDRLGEHLNTYRTIHSTMVGNFYNTENVCVFNRPVVKIDKYDTTYTQASVCSSFVAETDESGNPTGVITYYITWYDLSSIKSDLDTKITQFENAKKAFYQSVDGISYTGDSHDIQYWAKVDGIIYGRNGGTNHVNAVATKAEAMIKAYAKLKMAMTCTASGTDFPSDYETQCNSLLTKVTNLQSKYLTKGVPSNGDSYLTLVANIERLSADNIYEADPDSKVIKDGKTASQLLAAIAQDMKDIRGYCEKYVNIMTKVIDGGEVKRGEKDVTLLSLDSLRALAEQYKDKYDAYKQTVDGAPDTDLKEKMDEDIVNYDRAKYDRVDGEAVDEMKSRLSNIRSQYQAVMDAIDGMKYGDKKMVDITSYSTFKAQADPKVEESAIGITKSSVSNEANSSWVELIQPNLSSGQKVVFFNENAEYNLFLKPELHEVDVPVLYEFFYNYFKAPKDQEVDEQQEEMGKAEEASGKEYDENTLNRFVNSSAKDIASDISASSNLKFGFGVGINALIELITDLTEGNFNDIRDNAYISTYILEMFTYATYEKEGLYNLVYEDTNGSEVVKNLTGDTADSKYEEYNQEEEGKWKDESPVFGNNKTLTNKMKNATNNAAYRGELEYLLYGNAKCKDNVKAACDDIFSMRLLLNTISGFIQFWSGSNATANAIRLAGEAVFGLSCGVIPIAAVKAVLIMVLVAVETCNDMSRLSYGFPIEVYKDDYEDWKCALVSELTGEMNISKVMDSFGATNVVNTGEGFTYGDYVKLFVCLAVWGDDELKEPGVPETIMLRVGDLIQTNMRFVTGNSTYELSNANTHFKLHSKLKINPILVDIPLFGEYNQPLRDATGWMEYEVNAIRGY